MAKNSGQKLKLLYIIKILEEYTDENHPITTKELIEKLAMYDVAAERKSIYDDMARLQDFGYDIIQKDNRSGGGYYLGSRDFELVELKLLVDAVQSSRFVTEKKSRQLIGKLEKLVNKYDSKELHRQVYVAGRVKTDNEGIYYQVDAIQKAIAENKQIQFIYMEWNAKKELVPRREEKYLVSPWILMWQEEKYYLVATDNFMYYGGDGYIEFRKYKDVKHTHFFLDDILIKYLQINSPVEVKVKDRIIYKK